MSEDRATTISLIIFIVTFIVLLMYIDNITLPLAISLSLAILFEKANTKKN